MLKRVGPQSRIDSLWSGITFCLLVGFILFKLLKYWRNSGPQQRLPTKWGWSMPDACGSAYRNLDSHPPLHKWWYYRPFSPDHGITAPPSSSLDPTLQTWWYYGRRYLKGYRGRIEGRWSARCWRRIPDVRTDRRYSCYCWCRCSDVLKTENR